MKLLVSVRSGGEVGAALDGGADIIDAKEPRRGSLGPVEPDVLGQILIQIPHDRSASVALGDFAGTREVAAAIDSLSLPYRPTPSYLKLGFAGIRSQNEIERLIGAAVSTSNRRGTLLHVIAVAYADASRAVTTSPEVISSAAARMGARGVLLDTYIKDGLGLVEWIEPIILERWIAQAREAGLITAVAGSLALGDLEMVSAVAPDVVGVRGGACDGGRNGSVSRARVRAFREKLDSISGSVQGRKPVVLHTGSRNA